MIQTKAPPHRLVWTVHPLKDAFGMGLVLLVFIVTIPFFVYLQDGDLWLGLVAMLVLTFSLRSYFLPTRYILDEEGIICACFPLRVRRPWKAVKSWYVMDGAVRLSPFPSPSRMDAWRGLLLRCKNNDAEVLAYLRGRLPERPQ
jgi:hypothetical protein